MATKTLHDDFEVTPTDLFSLDGIVALVTGGGTGIGLMICTALASAGAKVYIVGRRGEILDETAKRYSPKANSKGGGEIIVLGTYDVRKKAEVDQMAKDFGSKEEHLDLLVNNAGIQPQMLAPKIGESIEQVQEKLGKLGEEEWQDVFMTNVASYYFTSAAFLHHLYKGRECVKGLAPSIVNISSKDAFQKTSTQNHAYATSKIAVVHLTKLLATEFQNLGIRVNAICPGQYPAEMTAGGRGSTEASNISHLEWPEEKQTKIPAGRPGSHKDMAGAILFLASRAGVYVNGHALLIDGGVLLTEPSSL